jgi:hypothetical protein
MEDPSPGGQYNPRMRLPAHRTLWLSVILPLVIVGGVGGFAPPIRITQGSTSQHESRSATVNGPAQVAVHMQSKQFLNPT